VRKVNEFKDTEIGRIPKEWEVVRLKEVVEKIKAGGTPLTTNPEYWNGDIPFVKIEDITSSTKYLSKTITFVSRKGLENSSAWIVPENSLLLTMYGSLGEVAITKIPVTTNQAILAIIPKKNKCETEFLYYWFLYFKPKWKKFAKPTTQANLTAEIIRETCIPLPPLPEQRKIAEILSTVDEAIQKVDEAIAKTERLKRGLMQRLLTKGIGHKEFKDTEIGRIPKEWEVRSVKDLFQVETGTTPSTKREEYWLNGSINWITPTDLSKLNGIYIQESERKITPTALKETNLTLIPLGSLVLSTRAPVGYVVVLKQNAVFNQGCKGLVPRDRNKVCPEFYYYLFVSMKRILQNLSGGSTFKELSKEKLENLKIPFPFPPEQRQIAEILSTVDRRLELERKRKEKLDRIKRGLMKDLLTGKVRVRFER
jgi:type I restriction enzyme S subunit